MGPAVTGKELGASRPFMNRTRPEPWSPPSQPTTRLPTKAVEPRAALTEVVLMSCVVMSMRLIELVFEAHTADPSATMFVIRFPSVTKGVTLLVAGSTRAIVPTAPSRTIHAADASNATIDSGSLLALRVTPVNVASIAPVCGLTRRRVLRPQSGTQIDSNPTPNVCHSSKEPHWLNFVGRRVIECVVGSTRRSCDSVRYTSCTPATHTEPRPAATLCGVIPRSIV